MATTHSLLYVYNASTLIVDSNPSVGHDVTIQNNGDQNLFIGGEGVNSEDFGFKLVPGAAISFELDSQDKIYAWCDTSTLVSILKVNLERAK